MAIDLNNLSPNELQALIARANAQMQEAHANQVRTVRAKIDAVLKSAGLTIGEVYPTRGGKKTGGKKGVVAPKYRNPNGPDTWSGRGRQPAWFAAALKKRGVTAESMLIDGVVAAKASPAKKVAPAKKAATKKKSAKKA